MYSFVNFYQTPAKRRQKYRYARKQGLPRKTAYKLRDTTPAVFCKFIYDLVGIPTKTTKETVFHKRKPYTWKEKDYA